MSTINSVSSSTNANSGLDQLVKQIMNNADTNNDGQLSSTEFGSFLTKLIERVSPGALSSQKMMSEVVGIGSTPDTTPAPAAAAAPTPTATPAASRISYDGMSGFDPLKLNDMKHTSPKYTFARTVQDMGFSPKDARGNLQAVVDQLKLRGFADAKTAGADKIDFGGNTGVVDVLTSWNAWWWGPNGS